MPLELRDRLATLSGVVTVDEVEPLVGWLRTTPKARINLRNCNHLHTAAIQALLLFQPKISVAPLDSFLATQVLPFLAGGSGNPDRQESEPP